jgi:hypothetical protein
VAVTVDRRRDRFDLGSERDSNSLGISSGLEFKPFALVSGRAFVGWNRVELLGTGAPSFRGLVTSVDLAYTLLGATRLTVQAERGLSYSAMRDQHAFLLAGVKGSIVRRMGANWDIGGRVGRHRASYGFFDLSSQQGSVAQSSAPRREHEIFREYGGQLGYLVGPDTRIALDVVRYRRRSTLDASRQYNVTRAGMSLTYRF